MKNATLARMSNLLLSGALVLFASASAFAQPANDECANAVTLQFVADSSLCGGLAGTSLGATQSSDPTDVCSASWFDDDVWFSFTTPSTMPSGVVVRMSFNDSITATDIVNPGMAIYASCGASELAIDCFSGGSDRLVLTSLAASTTYYVRCWSDNNSTPNGGTFDICVYGDNNVSSACVFGTLNTPGPLFVCAGDSSEVNTSGSQIPTGGGFGYMFIEGVNAGGGLAGGFTLTGAPEIYSFDDDLNGVLSANSLPVLVGQWLIRPVVYSDDAAPTASICDSSLATVEVNFLAATDPACDGVGINENTLSSSISIFPNPSAGELSISTALNEIDGLRVMSLDGKLVRDLGAVRFNQSNYSIDLTDVDDGVYFLHISKNGQQAMKRFVLAR